MKPKGKVLKRCMLNSIKNMKKINKISMKNSRSTMKKLTIMKTSKPKPPHKSKMNQKLKKIAKNIHINH